MNAWSIPAESYVSPLDEIKLPQIIRVEFDAFALNKAERNPFLLKTKAKLLKKLNFQYRSVFEQRDLAICLVALSRHADALQILDHAYHNVEFRRKYDVWYAAATACCVASWVRRQLGKPPGPGLQRFIDEPAHGLQTQPEIWTAAFVRKHLAEERGRFKPYFANPDVEVAVEAMCWWVVTLIFFREMVSFGFPKKGKLNIVLLDAWIEDGLERLGKRLHLLGK